MNTSATSDHVLQQTLCIIREAATHDASAIESLYRELVSGPPNDATAKIRAAKLSLGDSRRTIP